MLKWHLYFSLQNFESEVSSLKKDVRYKGQPLRPHHYIPPNPGHKCQSLNKKQIESKDL